MRNYRALKFKRGRKETVESTNDDIHDIFVRGAHNVNDWELLHHEVCLRLVPSPKPTLRNCHKITLSDFIVRNVAFTA